MGAGYLADTNAVIDLVAGRLPAVGAAWLERQLVAHRVSLSVINRIELLTKTGPAAEYELMQDFVHSVAVLPFEESVIRETIRLRQAQKVKKLPDAIIAATALVHRLVLITRNTNDFKNIPELTLLNLHHEQELLALGDVQPEDYA